MTKHIEDISHYWHSEQKKSEFYRKIRQEISDVLQENKIIQTEIRIGDILEFYKPLFKESKYYARQIKSPERVIDHIVHEQMFSRFSIKPEQVFTVYDIHNHEDNLAVRINKPHLPSKEYLAMDLFQAWFDMRYFQMLQPSLSFNLPSARAESQSG
jgi:hypothetical protein